jgi:nicotinamidase/pyrazinamidase
MRTVFVDVDTQFDFITPGGALYAPGAETITPVLRQLKDLATETGSLTLSTVDAHSESDPEFKVWKPHCVLGTIGQQKLSVTLRDKRYRFTTADPLDENAASQAEQILVEKQNVDPFTNPHLVALLQFIGPAHFLVYGLVTEVCVFHVARGLLKAGHSVELVEDAICPFSKDAGQHAIEHLIANGASLTTIERIAGAMRT